MPFVFDNTYARLGEEFFSRVLPTKVSSPKLIALNEGLADLLGISDVDLKGEAGAQLFSGNRLPEGAEPIALAYAGHQFGGFVPQLGDGRAILLGEIVGTDGHRRDIQLKGSGRTPFSRGGDGRAALGPVLREYVVSETMAALGVPTTRALAAVTTGEAVYRESALPGAVITRVATSHLRVGTFQYFAARGNQQALAKLTHYALERHYPDASSEAGPAVALLEAVIDAQARLVSRWLALGFVHGVMNTDNTSISGETIDYGPCAFLDAYDPQRSFSSIDHHGRYAFMNQPSVALWNLSRFAETLLPLVGDGTLPTERAVALLTERLERFPSRFDQLYTEELRRKLGLVTAQEGDRELAQDLLQLMADDRVDYTLLFRRLSDVAQGSDETVVTRLFSEPGKVGKWLEVWRARLAMEASLGDQAALMRRTNPAFIPRNHRIEEMIASATKGDFEPFFRLLRVLAHPYDDQAEAHLAEPPGEGQWSYRTFCGT